MKLTAENVEATFLSSLFEKEAEVKDSVVVEGIMTNVGFDPIRLDKNKSDIISMLDQLPDNFKKSSESGGWSFMMAHEDNTGEQWTGLHQCVEQLMLLGLAIGKIEYLAPRDMWKTFPGGIPYFVVLD